MLDATKLSIIYEPKGRAREYAPLACNLAVGCSHHCAYCYGPSAAHKAREVFEQGPVPTANALERLERDAARLEEANDTRQTLFCFLTDPYCPELVELTGEALMVMARHSRPFAVLTKGAWDAQAQFGLYFARDSFATTIVFADNDHCAEWEPNVEPSSVRWMALHEAISRGIDTWISLEPVIYPAEALEIIERGAEVGVGHVKIGPLNYHPHAQTVDWRRFGDDLAAVLAKTEIPYYLKHDMRRWMPPDCPVSTLPLAVGAEAALTCAVCGAEVVVASGSQPALFGPQGPLRCAHDPLHEHGCTEEVAEAV